MGRDSTNTPSSNPYNKTYLITPKKVCNQYHDSGYHSLATPVPDNPDNHLNICSGAPILTDLFAVFTRPGAHPQKFIFLIAHTSAARSPLNWISPEIARDMARACAHRDLSPRTRYIPRRTGAVGRAYQLFLRAPRDGWHMDWLPGSFRARLPKYRCRARAPVSKWNCMIKSLN